MKKQDWRKQTCELSWLRERQDVKVPGATDFEVFEWMQAIGLVPADVNTLPVERQTKLNLDPDAIPVGYLAAVAFEWDTWGKSTPTDILNAMEMETKGHERRDTIADTLSALGRAIAEEETEEVTYRLRLSAARAGRSGVHLASVNGR